MNEENLREIQQIVEQANAGNWIPLGVIGAVMVLVATLLVYIWNDKLKTNDSRHCKHEEMLSKLTETGQKTEVLLERMVVKTENHSEAIKELKQKIKL